DPLVNAVEAARDELRLSAGTEPLGRADHDTERFLRRLHRSRIPVRVHPLRELEPEALEAFGHQAFCKHLGRAISRLIAIERDQDALRAAGLERREQLVRKTVDAVAA